MVLFLCSLFSAPLVPTAIYRREWFWHDFIVSRSFSWMHRSSTLCSRIRMSRPFFADRHFICRKIVRLRVLGCGTSSTTPENRMEGLRCQYLYLQPHFRLSGVSKLSVTQGRRRTRLPHHAELISPTFPTCQINYCIPRIRMPVHAPSSASGFLFWPHRHRWGWSGSCRRHRAQLKTQRTPSSCGWLPRRGRRTEGVPRVIFR